MSYKFKSLLYFTCFVASALVYYNMEHEANPAEPSEMIGMTDSVSTTQQANEIVQTAELTY